MSNKTHPARDSEVWIRLGFILLFAIIFSIVQYVIFLVALAQAAFSLFSRTPNEQLQKFGAGLAEYARLLSRYITFNTATRPFPFADWQAGSAPDGAQKATKDRPPPSGPSASSAKSATKKAPAAQTKKTKATKPKAEQTPQQQDQSSNLS